MNEIRRRTLERIVDCARETEEFRKQKGGINYCGLLSPKDQSYYSCSRRGNTVSINIGFRYEKWLEFSRCNCKGDGPEYAIFKGTKVEKDEGDK